MEKAAFIILISFFAGYWIDDFWARVVRGWRLQKKRYYKMVIRNIRIHHNFLGYVFVLIGLFYYPLVFVPAGLGVIVSHRVRDRIHWFLEVVERDIESVARAVGRRKN